MKPILSGAEPKDSASDSSIHQRRWSQIGRLSEPLAAKSAAGAVRFNRRWAHEGMWLNHFTEPKQTRRYGEEVAVRTSFTASMVAELPITEWSMVESLAIFQNREQKKTKV